MEWPEVKSALLELGWSGAELGRRVGVHPNTVSQWATGKARVPGAVAAYLRLAVEVHRLVGLVGPRGST